MTGHICFFFCTCSLCIANEVSWKNTSQSQMSFLLIHACAENICVQVTGSSKHFLLQANMFQWFFSSKSMSVWNPRDVFVCCGTLSCLQVFPALHMRSSNTFSITLRLFQFSSHYHIISYPSNKTPNTQAAEVIQLQIAKGSLCGFS